MAGSNINRVIITGNLTRDPELNTLPGSGTTVCSLRVACNGRRKNNETGQWEDCGKYLSKGRPIAVDGRLRWREWTTPEGQKRQAVDIIGETVQFLGGRDDAGNGNGFSSSVRAAESDIPIDTGDFQRAPAAAGAADDDIPF
jgi:single-strand DNA-binding protein